MSIIKKTGSITALLACLTYGSVNSAYAAQLDFQDPFQSGTPAEPNPVQPDSDLCEEEPTPDAELQSLKLGPNLVASSAVSDTALGLQGRTLIAQGPICDLGGVAPEGGGAIGGPGILPILAGLAGAGGIAAIAATGGGDDAPEVVSVPEPSELATAGLFASLGIAGVLLRRKNKKED